jgi:hypothetical protein
MKKLICYFIRPGHTTTKLNRSCVASVEYILDSYENSNTSNSGWSRQCRNLCGSSIPNYEIRGVDGLI